MTWLEVMMVTTAGLTSAEAETTGSAEGSTADVVPAPVPAGSVTLARRAVIGALAGDATMGLSRPPATAMAASVPPEPTTAPLSASTADPARIRRIRSLVAPWACPAMPGVGRRCGRCSVMSPRSSWYLASP